MLADFLPSPLTPGRVAALNMLQKTTELESVPFFWTVLVGKSIRYTGILTKTCQSDQSVTHSLFTHDVTIDTDLTIRYR